MDFGCLSEVRSMVVWVLFLCLTGSAAWGQGEDPRSIASGAECVSGAPGDWVRRPPAAGTFPWLPKEPGRPRRFLVVDDQVNVGTGEHFVQRSYELLDAQGVQEGSEFLTFELNWDPDAEDWTANWAMIALVGMFVPLAAVGIAAAHRRFPWLPAVPPIQAAVGASTEIQGLGGWLVLVGLGVAFTPFRLMADLAEWSALFDLRAWTGLAHPAGTFFHPSFGIVLPMVVLANTALLLISLWQVVLFFGRHRLFPRVFIGFLVTSLLAQGVDWGMLLAVPSLGEDGTGMEVSRDLVRSMMTCVIWIPYVLQSRRVKNTFVR